VPDGDERSASAPSPGTPGKEPWFQLDRNIDEPQSRYRLFGEEKKLLLLLDSNAELSNALYNFVAFPLPAI